jgi:hypothetical protein
MFRCVERLLGVTQDFCKLDGHVPNNVGAVLIGEALVSKLSTAPATWTQLLASGEWWRQVKVHNPDVPHKLPFHAAPISEGETNAGHGAPFQAGSAFFVNFDDNVRHLEQQHVRHPPPPKAKAKSTFEPDKQVLNRTSVVGRFAGASGRDAAPGPESFQAYFQELHMLRNKLILVMLAVAARIWEGVGGCDVVMLRFLLRSSSGLSLLSRGTAGGPRRSDGKRNQQRKGVRPFTCWSWMAAKWARSRGQLHLARTCLLQSVWTRWSTNHVLALTLRSCARRASRLTGTTTWCSSHSVWRGW